MDVIRPATVEGGGPRRSTPGQGQQCFIHVIGRADEYADSIIGGYGQISAGCGPNLGEDFSETIWSVVVKVMPCVVEGDLIQHLRDLADSLEKHTMPEDMQLTLAEGWRRQREKLSEFEGALLQAVSASCGVAERGGKVVNIATRRNLPPSGRGQR